MKKIFLFVFILGFLASCKDKDQSNTELIGDWKLIEILADPGDGSGTFTPVESDLVMTFHSDGSLTSNGSLCFMSTEADNPTSGTYSITDSSYSSADCNDPDYNYTFEHTGSLLIVNFPCIEPCKAKFEKI